MVEYKADEPSDVFDLTALASEIASHPNSDNQHCRIELSLIARTDYAAAADPTSNKRPLKTEASWNVMADFKCSGSTGWLDDAINASMPDSIATQELRKKLKRITTKADQITAQIQSQRLTDAAAVRHQHPIARVKIDPLALPEAK